MLHVNLRGTVCSPRLIRPASRVIMDRVRPERNRPVLDVKSGQHDHAERWDSGDGPERPDGPWQGCFLGSTIEYGFCRQQRREPAHDAPSQA